MKRLYIALSSRSPSSQDPGNVQRIQALERKFVSSRKVSLSFEDLSFSSEHLEASKIFREGGHFAHLHCCATELHPAAGARPSADLRTPPPVFSSPFVTDCRESQREAFRSRIREESGLISRRTNPGDIYKSVFRWGKAGAEVKKKYAGVKSKKKKFLLNLQKYLKWHVLMTLWGMTNLGKKRP